MTVADAPRTALIRRNTVCAVIVTYFPEETCPAKWEKLVSQVGGLIIVDNGSSASSVELVEAAGRRLGATVVQLGRNLGIAFALNVGRRMAEERGYRWLATFDQDSQATPGMIDEMRQILDVYPHPDKVAIISPCHVDQCTGLPIRNPFDNAAGMGWRLILSTMTSGNLVNLDVAAAVGGFDDSLFIDFVDHEFCLRLRESGYQVLEATRAVLLHSVGNIERRLFIFKQVTVSNHAAIRRYYITRNRLIMWRRYWRKETRWVLGDIRRFPLECLYIFLYEKDVATKATMIWRGFKDGITNRLGAYDPEASQRD